MAQAGEHPEDTADQSPRPESQVKHWRRFGRTEWLHVRDGVLAALVGSVLPVALFYAAYRLISFPVSVGVVLIWSSAVFVWHRRRTGRADAFSATTFGFAWLKAAAGLASQSPWLYLAWPSLENVIYGLAFFVSALLGRPLLALYARRVYPLPEQVQTAPVFRRAFVLVGAVWLVGNLLRGALRLLMLDRLPLEWYLALDPVAGWPINAALVGFAIWWPLRQLRRAGLMADDGPAEREPRLGVA